MIDYFIEKLQELLIKQKFKDEKKGIAYVKKVDAYKDLIIFLKEMKRMEENNNEILEKKN